jgi:F420-dependent oxidoreductase-like protein
VKLSISLTDYAWPQSPAAHLDTVARGADSGGLDTIFVPDHLVQAQPGLAQTDPMFEAFTTLGYLAARTSRVRLGAMVAAATFRSPALLVKSVTALDVLSGGRAWFGVGAGHHAGEAADLGLDFPATTERFDRLDETLQIALRMFAGDERPIHGEHHGLERPLNRPNSVQRPHPPILVGGMGERRTLRLVARYADACNLGDVPDGGATITRKLGVLAGHCADLDRDYTAIEKTVSTRLLPGETATEFTDRCATLADLGLQHVVVIASGPWTPERLSPLLDAVPAASRL